MSARRLCFILLTMPIVTMAAGCMSAPLAAITEHPLSTDRMMAIGQTFERQGRFGQAQEVYQQVLQIDPVSPAAERLLAVIAAADVTNAQNLPVERMMSVGEFYERHGNLPLAQGIYKQILQRQPDYDPARDRLTAIAAHEEQKLGHSSPSRVEPRRSAINRGSVWTEVPAQHEGIANTVQQSSDILEVDYEQPVTESESNAPLVEQAISEVASNAPMLDEPSIPPSPSPSPSPSPMPMPMPPELQKFQDSLPEQYSGSSAAELWRDKPLRELKAAILPKFKDLEKLRDTERQRLNQAAPLMAARGASIQTIGQSRPWLLSSYEWEAPATRHLPLLFEEPNLERMGYTYGCYWNICGFESGPHQAECLQPFVSGVCFVSRVAMVPYILGIDPPGEPIYTLGVDRPGSPVPYRKYLIPLSIRGAIYQAGFMTGLSFLP